MTPALLLLLASLFLIACTTAPAAVAPPEAAAVAPQPADPFVTWLSAEVPVADGFSDPVDGAWADCGPGCWSHEGAAPVMATAHGRVADVGPDHLVLEHQWYEDQVRAVAQSTWTGLRSPLTVGTEVQRGDPIGTSARLQGSISTADGPLRTFLRGHRERFVPQDEPALALISHDLDELRIYRDGVETMRTTVGFGQAEGDKQRRGDLMTPKGMYFVVVKSKGPFTGRYGAYYGGTWIKINYPNAWDAARGVDEGLITSAQQRSITRAWSERALTPQGTVLGSGIGLHGWIEEWPDDGPHGLSWGCIVMHLRDNQAVYASLPEGSMVVLF
jgi:hypothetical protein